MVCDKGVGKVYNKLLKSLSFTRTQTFALQLSLQIGNILDLCYLTRSGAEMENVKRSVD